MVIKELNQTKTTGSDWISSKALKMAVPNISQSMIHLFNKSVFTGQFSSTWKIVRATPLFKEALLTDWQLPPCISMSLESFINSGLKNFTHKVGLVEQHQFAYSKFSSTTVALIFSDIFSKEMSNAIQEFGFGFSKRSALTVVLFSKVKHAKRFN